MEKSLTSFLAVNSLSIGAVDIILDVDSLSVGAADIILDVDSLPVCSLKAARRSGLMFLMIRSLRHGRWSIGFINFLASISINAETREIPQRRVHYQTLQQT